MGRKSIKKRSILKKKTKKRKKSSNSTKVKKQPKVSFPKNKKHKGMKYTLYKIGEKNTIKKEARRLKNSFQYFVLIKKKKNIYALYRVRRKETEERFALSLDTRGGVD